MITQNRTRISFIMMLIIYTDIDILGNTVLDSVDGGIDTTHVFTEKGNKRSIDLECKEDSNDLDANSDSNTDDEKMWDTKIKATISGNISEKKQDENKQGDQK